MPEGRKEGAVEKLAGPARRQATARRRHRVPNGQHQPLSAPHSHSPSHQPLSSPQSLANLASADIAPPSSCTCSQPPSQSPPPPPPTATPAEADAPPLELSGASAGDPAALLFKLKGSIARQDARILLDSGATSEFIDSDFAKRHGLRLEPSNREIKLADGSIARAEGQVTIEWDLAAHKGAPLPFSSTFTVTSLGQYDAILGMTWLTKNDPIVGWRSRTLEIRPEAGDPLKVPRLVLSLIHI